MRQDERMEEGALMARAKNGDMNAYESLVRLFQHRIYRLCWRMTGAHQARVEGVVILEAQTDLYGRVATMKILRSIPLLDQAALDAARQWVYEPMIINGRPRGVIFTVTVRFTLK